MPSVTISVAASADDANSQSNTPDTGSTSGNIAAGDLTATLLSPGDHGANNVWYVGCRFVTSGANAPASGNTITSALLKMTAASTYSAGANVIKFTVSCQDDDSPNAFATSEANDLDVASRPRTTANSVITATSVTGGTTYDWDITSAVQEVVNRAGWAAGNEIVVIVESHADTTTGEWQDYYAFDHASGQEPQLFLNWSAGGGAQTINANHLAAGTTLHQPSAAPGTVTVSANHLASATVLHQPAVRQTIGAQHLAAATILYQPVVTPGAVTVQANHLTAGTTLHQPAVSPGAVAVTANYLAAETALHQPEVEQQIAANQLAASTALHQPQVAPGAVSVSANHLAALTALYDPSVNQGAATIAANHLAAATQLPNPAVEQGIAMQALAAGTVIHQPEIEQVIAALALAAGTTLHQASVAVGAVTIAVNHLAAATALYNPAIGGRESWSVAVGGDGYTDGNPKQIVRTSGDRAYIVVMECDAYPSQAGDVMFVYRANQTGIPNTFTQFATGVADAATVAVGIDASDDIHVAWHSRTGGQLFYRVWDTATDAWAAAAETVETGLETGTGQGDTRLSLALDSDGVAHIVYLKSDGTRQRISYRNRVGGTWSSATQLDSGVTYGSNERAWLPNVIFDMLGNRVASWHRGTFNATTGGACFVSVYRSGAWQTPVNVGASWIEIDNNASLMATVDGANDNRIHLAFVDAAANTDEEIRYYYSDDAGATWTDNHPGSGTAQTHNPVLGPGPNLTVRIYGHGTPDASDHGDDITYFQGDGGGATWGTRQTLVVGTDFDSSVNTRWSRYHHHSAGTLDIAYWDDDYPNLLYYGGALVNQSLRANALSSGTALYTPGVSLATIVNALALAAGTTLHQAGVTAGAVTLQANYLAATTALYDPTVSTAAIVQALAIAAGTSLHQPSIVPGTATVNAAHLAAGTLLYQPDVAQTVAAQQLAAATVVYSPNVVQHILAHALASTAALYAPSVTVGAVTVMMLHLSSGTTLYVPGIGGVIDVRVIAVNASDDTLLLVVGSEDTFVTISASDSSRITVTGSVE